MAGADVDEGLGLTQITLGVLQLFDQRAGDGRPHGRQCVWVAGIGAGLAAKDAHPGFLGCGPGKGVGLDDEGLKTLAYRGSWGHAQVEDRGFFQSDHGGDIALFSACPGWHRRRQRRAGPEGPRANAMTLGTARFAHEAWPCVSPCQCRKSVRWGWWAGGRWAATGVGGAPGALLVLTTSRASVAHDDRQKSGDPGAGRRQKKWSRPRQEVPSKFRPLDGSLLGSDG